MKRAYRTREVDENQTCLFPQDLESNTEYWFDWQYAEIIKIQDAMLTLAIAEVRDRRKSRKMREEAWNWLMTDNDTPFSARICASNNGYDIDVLRSLIKRLITDIE